MSSWLRLFLTLRELDPFVESLEPAVDTAAPTAEITPAGFEALYVSALELGIVSELLDEQEDQSPARAVNVVIFKIVFVFIDDFPFTSGC